MGEAAGADLKKLEQALDAPAEAAGKELTKAERAALFKQQNQAKIDAQKAAKEKEKLSKAERAAIQEAQRASKGSTSEGAAGTPATAPGGGGGGGGAAAAAAAASAPTAPQSALAAGHAGGGQPGKGSAGYKLQHDDPKAMAKAQRTAALQRTEVLSTKRVAWFSHLPQYERETSITLQLQKTNNKAQSVRKDNYIDPAVVTLGLKFADWLVVGANKRTQAILQALCKVVVEYECEEMVTSADLSRNLDQRLKPLISYLVACRPISIGMGNAIRWLKSKIAHLPANLGVQEAKEHLEEQIENYIMEKIVFADRIISKNAAAKIRGGDVLLVYGRSSAVEAGLLGAHKEGTAFRVIVVDSRPKFEGKQLLEVLVAAGIPCTYILINSLSYVMKEVSKVLLGACAMLANGNVISRAGSSMVALMAKQYNVPVLVCCETYKFSEKVMLDSICSNELADPDELISSEPMLCEASIRQRCCPKDRSLADWRDVKDMKLLNLVYDLTPADLIVLVITELGYLPPSSVPVVIREYRKEVTL